METILAKYDNLESNTNNRPNSRKVNKWKTHLVTNVVGVNF